MAWKQWIIRGGTLVGMVVLCLLLSPGADALSGSGTQSSPYVIETAADLAAMGDDLDGYYELGGNIDLNGVDFAPVGNEWDGPFTGTLDGKGFTISHLTVENGALKYAGLFGYLEGTVRDLTLSDVLITGNRFAGAIAGTVGVGGSVTDCTVSSGSVTAEGSPMWTSAGGVAGVCEGIITRCTNGADVSIDSNTSPSYAGGLAGVLSEPLIAEDCSNSGQIRTGYYQTSGGLFGKTEARAELHNCTNSGTVIADGWRVVW